MFFVVNYLQLIIYFKINIFVDVFLYVLNIIFKIKCKCLVSITTKIIYDEKKIKLS